MTDVADADSEDGGTDHDAEPGSGAGSAETDPRAEATEKGSDSADEAADPVEDEEGSEREVTADESGADEADAPEELVARVAAVDVEVAAEVEALYERIADLEAELDERADAIADRDETIAEQAGRIDELESKVKRARADFQNYKKRARQRQEEIEARATEDLVERLLDVRDNLVRAVEQDDDVDVRDGVEATLATFDRVLDSENVSAIEPDPGEDVDPERHEVVHRVECDHPDGAIADVFRPGYDMAGKVLRPAQVTVSEGAPDEADGDEDEYGTPSEG